MNKKNMRKNKPARSNSKKIPFKSGFFILLLMAGIVASMFFSTKYVFNNANLGNLYGDGIKVTVNLKNVDNNGAPNGNSVTNKELTQAENSIYSRASDLGYGKPFITTNKDDSGKYSFTISQPNIKTEDIATSYVTQLVSKTTLSFYSTTDKSLFDSSGYNPNNPTGVLPPNAQPLDIVKQDSAKYTQKRRGSRLLNTIGFDYANSKSKIAYTKALQALAKGDAKKGENRMVVWVGYDALYKLATTIYKKDFDAAKDNLYNFVHVYDKNKKMTQALKTKPFNARDYLISDAPVAPGSTAPDKTVYINSSFQPDVAKSLADRINYGSSSYKLFTVGRYSFVNAPFGKTAINRIEISALVILALIIILLVARYGVFGIVSAFAITLFIGTLLLLFTLFKGELTLLTIGAIVFGVLLMLDASVLTFERLKRELYGGKSIGRAISASNKYSIPVLFDSSFVVLVISFVIFYIGAKLLPGFSIVIVLSVLLTMLLSLIFIKVLTKILVKVINWNDKTSFLIGNYESQKNVYLHRQEKLAKFNYFKTSKWALIGSATIMFAGIIAFSTFAGISGSISKGFNSGINLTGGQRVWIRSVDVKDKKKDADTSLPQILTSQEVKYIYGAESMYKDNVISITNVYSTVDKTDVNGIIVIFNKNFNDADFVKRINDYVGPLPGAKNTFDVRNTHFSSFVDKKIIKTTLYAFLIMFLFILAYILLRFRWTFAFAMLIALIHDGLIVTAVFVVGHIPFSSLFIISMIIVMFYSIFNKMLVFNRMRVDIKNTKIENASQFKTIMHNALGETMNRNIIMLAIFVVIGLLISIPFATNMVFSLTMIIGAIIGSLSIYLVFPWFWVKLETLRFNVIQKRILRGKSKSNIEEEQTFENINQIKDI